MSADPPGVDPVREFLRKSGAPPSQVAHGLRGLVEHWEGVVRRVTEGYDQSLDDYLNDMDSRQLLENALDIVPSEIRAAFQGRVNDADLRIRLNLVPAGYCLWGAIVAADEGWRAGENWWYFERPRFPGPLLRRDLDSR